MITAETITDEQIRALLKTIPAPEFGSFEWQRTKECLLALHDEPSASDYPTSERRTLARARCAEILNARSLHEQLATGHA